MNRNTLLLTASLALTLVAGPALAGPKCTDEAKDKWLSEEAMKQRTTRNSKARDTIGYYCSSRVKTPHCCCRSCNR